MDFKPLLFLKQKRVISAGGWMLAAAILAFSFAGLSGRILGFRALFVQIEGRIAEYESDRDNARKTSILFKERQDDFERIRKFFPSRSSPVGFIEYLEALGRTAGAPITLAVDEAKSGRDSLFFQLTAEGEERSVRTVMRAFDVLPYDISIEEINFMREETGTASGGSPAPRNRGSSAVSRVRVSFIVQTSP